MEREFGRLPDGGSVCLFSLTDGHITCELLNYGGTLRALYVPDRGGVLRDVVLGFDTLEDYLTQDKYLGATLGRFANRIGGAAFSLGGTEYRLAANDGKNHLHGGLRSFDRRLWTVEESGSDTLRLSLVSPDLDEGYPGTLRVTLRYTVKDAALRIDYEAVCDRDTVCSLTNHSYFQLDGHDAGSALDHRVQLLASRFTPVRADMIPDGRLLPVDGTPMDLRTPTRLRDVIGAPFEQLHLAHGFDHNYVPDGAGLRLITQAEGPQHGIRMRVLSTMPGVQFYTANFLKGCPAGKGGAIYNDRDGFCLETQHFPDAPNRPSFPSALLRAGEAYRHTTVYAFSCGR